MLSVPWRPAIGSLVWSPSASTRQEASAIGARTISLKATVLAGFGGR